jgi:uncharacterized protein
LKVLILGASDKNTRTSYTARLLLKDYGHDTILVHPTLKNIDSETVYSSLDLAPKADIITIYVSAEISSTLEDALIKKYPKKIIFNPGSENPTLAKKLESSGIQVEEACTLVLLKTRQFTLD